MSLNKTQIDALIDRTCKSSAVSYSVADKTADENIALDATYAMIFAAGGTWQFDDSNHTDYPIVTTNLVSGQRDYQFVSDQQGNLMLDIYKVMVKDASGVYQEITPVDVQSEGDTSGFYDGRNETGIPNKYDKTATGIFLDKIPNYNSTDGLKVYINREGSYFSTSDTTKKPGFAGLFHEYIAIRPSYQYAFRNSLANLKLIFNEMVRLEAAIKDYYGKRERDIKRRMTPTQENNK